jgi:hypothetical protein
MLPDDGLTHVSGRWFPDGNRFVLSGNEPGRAVRLYVEDTAGGNPRAISPEGVNALAFAISSDGRMVAGVGPDGKGYLYPTAGGDPQAIRGFEPGEEPITWGRDAHSLYVDRPGEIPASVYRLDVTTSQRTLWKQLSPSDPAGAEFIGPVVLTPDAEVYVYGVRQLLSDLYLVQGLN